MDDEREEVHQDPLGPVVALDMRRPDLRGAQRLLDRVRDRLHLPHVLAGADQEEVGEGGRVRADRARRRPWAFLSSAACTAVEISAAHAFSATAATVFSFGHATDLPLRFDRDGDDGCAFRRAAAPGRAIDSPRCNALRGRPWMKRRRGRLEQEDRRLPRNESTSSGRRMRAASAGSRAASGIDRVARPCDHDEVREIEHLGIALPGGNFCKRVRADDEENLRCAASRARAGGRAYPPCTTVPSIRSSSSLANSPGTPDDGESGHGEAVKRRSDRLNGAVRRDVRRARPEREFRSKASRAAAAASRWPQ